MRSMCVFRRKYMHSAALTPDRPPARPPGRQPSPASPPGSRSASQRVPRASGIIVGNANEVLNRKMPETSVAAIPPKKPEGRADAERQRCTSSTLFLHYTYFIVYISDISQLGRVRLHQPEFSGNANGFPTGACCVRPPLLKSPPAAAEWAKPREDPPRHFRRSTRRGERMPNGSVG